MALGERGEGEGGGTSDKACGKAQAARISTKPLAGRAVCNKG